jgi:hypothetical protein
MQVNDFIRFRFTGEKGKILKDFLDGSFKVLLLKDNEDIIAFKEDILLEKDFKGIEKSQPLSEKGDKKIKKLSTEEMFFSKEELEQRNKKVLLGKVVKDLKTTITPENQKDEDSFSYVSPFNLKAPQNSGVWLAFVPQSSVSYVVYLVNDSNYSIKFRFVYSNNQQTIVSLNQVISPYDYFPVADFHSNMLNESPIFELSCPTYHLSEQFKLKFKKWISMSVDLPVLGINCPGHLFFSSDRISKASLNPSNMDLKTYTQSNLKKSSNETNSNENLNEVQLAAEFSREIDLHAEKLISNLKDLSPLQIFQIQKSSLENYMRKAIELEIDEVFIIHGLGEGILRKAVELHLTSLRKEKLINEFKNEYHNGYGFGATRVRIR